MKLSTMRKVVLVRIMIRDGVTEKEIIKQKFKGSPKYYREWLDKFGKYLTMGEEEPVSHEAIMINKIEQLAIILNGKVV